jgi:mannose-6-phosphate isomerase
VGDADTTLGDVERTGGEMADAQRAMRSSGMALEAPRQPVEDLRPWGRFRQYTLNEPTTVKLITVEAGQVLSLQRHQHRDELWIVLDDTIWVELDGEQVPTRAGDEHFIPRGTLHRVGAEDGVGRFVEIAFGAFDEDDIERLDDAYGRS